VPRRSRSKVRDCPVLELAFGQCSGVASEINTTLGARAIGWISVVLVAVAGLGRPSASLRSRVLAAVSS
jgi:hypothetical protein